VLDLWRPEGTRVKKKMITGACGIALGPVLLAGCGGHAATHNGQSVDTQKAATVVHCDNIKGVIPANLATTGCLDRQGGIVVIGSWDCKDGRILFGDDKLWGYAGGTAHHDVPESDPAYAKAYSECDGA